MDTLGHRMHQASDLLSVPGALAKDLDRIVTLLTAVQKGAKTAEAVEQIKAEAKKVSAAVTPALVEVKAARDQAAALAETLKPAAKATKVIGDGAAVTATGLNGFSSAVLKNEPAASRMGQFSIVHFAPPVQTCIQGKVDDLAARLDRTALAMDKVVLLLLTDYSLQAPALAGLDLHLGKLDPLAQLQAEIAKLDARLAAMTKGIKDLEDFLDTKFTVKIPYLAGTYEVKIKMSYLIEDAKAIEDAIKDKASDVVWEAAKVFGVKALIKKVLEEANDAFEDMARKMHLNPNMTIPGLDKLAALKGEVEALAGAFPGTLKVPAFTLNTPDFGWPNVPAGVDFRSLELDLKQLAPLGYKWDLVALETHAPNFGCQ